MSMQIYYAPRTRAFSALWLMEETGEPYEKVLTDVSAGAHKSAEFLKVNPMGKVPSLTDGDAALGEAAAICAYVAERYPDAGLAPPLSDHSARATYLYWLFFGPSCIEPAIMQAFTKMQVPPTMAGWGTTEQVFDVLDAALAEGPWLLGDRFSAADIVIGSGVGFAVRAFKMIPTRPNFERYLDACAARPAYRRAEKIAAG